MKRLTTFAFILGLTLPSFASFAPINKQKVLEELKRPCPLLLLISEEVVDMHYSSFERVLDILIFNDEFLELKEYNEEAFQLILKDKSANSKSLEKLEQTLKITAQTRKMIRTYIDKLINTPCALRINVLSEFPSLHQEITNNINNSSLIISELFESSLIDLDAFRTQLEEQQPRHVPRRKPKYNNGSPQRNRHARGTAAY